MTNSTSSTSRTSENWAEIYAREGTPFEQALAIAGCTGDNIERLKPKNTTPALEAAMGYAIFRGWEVFPADVAEKKSYLSAEHAPEHKPWGMTKDLEQLRRNFVHWKWRLTCGVAVPTGAMNGIFDIEADTHKGHGRDGLASIEALEAKHGKLPDTLMAESPSGSIHRIYKHPGRGIKIKNSTSEIGPGIDVRGDGGMFVAPPSVRKDGAYRWLNNLPIADAPQWLLDLVCEDAPEQSNGGEKNWAEKCADEPIGKIAAAMAAIPNTADIDRDGWVDIGMALKRELPGDDGLQLFQEWSARWEGWARGEGKGRSAEERAAYTAATWKDPKPRKPEEGETIGVGTLFYLADQADPDWRSKYEAERNTSDEVPQVRLMQTSAEFVAGFVPPDYLIDGLLQRRYVYSFTAPTGSGKTAIALLIAAHVATGETLAGREVEKGRVLFFAGENPDDVRARWIKLCEELGEDPNTMDVVFMPFTPKLSETKIREQIDAEAAEHGPFSLLIVDTSASYYSGDDENDNVALGNHARMLRTFVNLPGGPTILVTCHPTKNPNMDNLLPRGGGAFLAEVDGNLVCIKDLGTMTVEVTTHGKFRGPDFAPFSFKLVAGQSEKLVDSKGRSIWSIFARADHERGGGGHQGGGALGPG